MKVETPEIRWHCGPTGLNEAVLTIDFLRRQAPRRPAGNGPTDDVASVAAEDTGLSTPRLPAVMATGGADKEIKLWTIGVGDAPIFVHSLSGHERSVNCVRFSPCGRYLASASDDSTIVVWMRPKHLDDDDAGWDWSSIATNSDISRVLLACGHKGDITDLSWSPDSTYLCSASIDNTTAIWHLASAKLIEKRKDHSQYVQGVAWDPLSEFLVTQGNDRSCRVYALTGYATHMKKKKCQLVHTNRSREVTDDIDDEKKGKYLLFHDDTFPAFSRRLTWTPDGNFCLVPTGLFKPTEAAPVVHTVYVYARGNLSLPAFHLSGHDKGALGVRCSPILYTLRPDTTTNVFHLPYRVLFCVATLTSLVVYDSQLPHPICVIDRVHYADLTDLSWSDDGLVLAASSLDGYVTFVTFDAAELGPRAADENALPAILARQRARLESNVPVPKRKAKDKDDAATPKKEKAAPSPDVKPANSIRQFTTVVDLDAAFDPANMPVIVPSENKAGPAVHVVAVRKKRKITSSLAVQPTAAAPAAPTLATTPPVKKKLALGQSTDSTGKASSAPRATTSAKANTATTTPVKKKLSLGQPQDSTAKTAPAPSTTAEVPVVVSTPQVKKKKITPVRVLPPANAKDDMIDLTSEG
ncbi:Aste57867_9607 [Aphanomyces stellatus]|uniref:Aste57867_9607 protein n=1 Tax=Aphanomyces stellatus TaxID=120398 RepID=A0A485KNU0_9STRA|nr:hypothetical protein As57867_009569 [Aphanomyces stellatus]VFT86486.1 Aste57867_9607 [Aphanomyces stellatus]